MSNTKLNHFVSRAIPDSVKEDNPQFATFIEKYFEYISRDLGEYDLSVNLLKYINIDETVSDFYDEFKSLYVPLLPEKYKASLSNIVKNAHSFYQSKGTEESFHTFFRMVFDTTLNLYFPKVDMLRVSDGRWTDPYYIQPTDQVYDNLLYFYDKSIRGSISNATAYVENILQVEDPTNAPAKIFVLSLVNRTGVFIDTDIITVDGEITPTTGLSATDTVITDIGYYVGTDGFISWNKYIQDSYYYQDYSYVIESGLSVNVYERPTLENIHPAGLKLFGLVKAELSILDYGTDLASFIAHVIEWINQENIEQSINSTNREISAIPQSPKWNAGNDFDWRYYEENRESTPFVQLYSSEQWNDFPINYFSTQYPELFATVTVDGIATTEFSIIEGVLILDTPLASDVYVVVTSLDETAPINNRVYTFYGNTGEDTFVLPTKINRMLQAGATNDSIVITA